MAFCSPGCGYRCALQALVAQQMVDFFRQHTAMDEPNIQTEVDRYIAWPAQALAYKLGQMKIVELRERARDSLGDKFDIRAFHDAVLADGPPPLEVLETRINEGITAQKTVRWVPAE